MKIEEIEVPKQTEVEPMESEEVEEVKLEQVPTEEIPKKKVPKKKIKLQFEDLPISSHTSRGLKKR